MDERLSLDVIREAMAEIEKMPTPISGLWTSHNVPYGRVFRQWDTLGRLWCWCSRGEVEDLPRGPRKRSWSNGSVICDFSAIPIYNR